MKTLVYKGPLVIVEEEQEKPRAAAGEAVIRVLAVGICGSELEGYLGHSSVRQSPLVMGHEFCGEISEIDPAWSGKEGLSIGDRVVVNPLIACGSCDRCLMGRSSVCRNRRIVGINRPGAFAEYVSVPCSNVYKVPQGMNCYLASLAEPLAVSVRGLRLGYNPLDDIIIFGAGPIGILSLQAAMNMGANKVLVVDKRPERLEFARLLGAETTEPEHLIERNRHLFGDKGVETVVDCVGVQSTREQALQSVNPGGTVVMVGLGQDQTAISMNHLVRQEVRIIGSYTCTPEDFEQSLDLLINGKIMMNSWASIRGLTEGPACFKELADGSSKFSKIILEVS